MLQSDDQVRQERLQTFTREKVQIGPAQNEGGFGFGPIRGLAPTAGMRRG